MASAEFRKLNLVVQFAEIIDGKAKSRNATLANIRHDITPDQIDQVGTAMATLSALDYVGIEKVTYEYIV